MSTGHSLHQSGARRCHTCGSACELVEIGSDHYWVCTNGECQSTWAASGRELGELARYNDSWDRNADRLRRRSLPDRRGVKSHSG